MGLPSDYRTTRDALHLVAVHVVARRRYAATGRFGLRAMPGGFGAPNFGTGLSHEVVRTDGVNLVRETIDTDHFLSMVYPIDGSTLDFLTEVVGTLVDDPFSVGRDTPEVGDAHAVLRVGAESARIVGAWFADGTQAIDRLLAAIGPAAAPTVAQLWPEHFDLGIDVAVGPTRVNLGASAGDRFHEDPYVYVGPRGDARPGDPAFWNAPFGALLGYDAIAPTPDPIATMTDFFRRGLDQLR